MSTNKPSDANTLPSISHSFALGDEDGHFASGSGTNLPLKVPGELDSDNQSDDKLDNRFEGVLKDDHDGNDDNNNDDNKEEKEEDYHWMLLKRKIEEYDNDKSAEDILSLILEE